VSVEMNATPDHVVKTMASMPVYVELFKKAFPNETAPVTFARAGAPSSRMSWRRLRQRME
jgi:cytochrome c peroxidase